MPNRAEIFQEIQNVATIEAKKSKNALDIVRHKYLKNAHRITGRNIIAYYSGFLQRPNARFASVNDKDIQALMQTIHGMKRDKGLDIILHTPGGDLAAAEQIVQYLREMFGTNIRAIVPQIAMSAGTMLALSCKLVMMGKHSNLGPTDPQINGVPCHAVIEEFNKAKQDIIANPNTAHLWTTIIRQYHPTFLTSCEKAIALSQTLVQEWIATNMHSSDAELAKCIADEFCNHEGHKTHNRHISREKCVGYGVSVEELEKSQQLQEAILSAHHAYMHTFAYSNAIKIVENHNGVAYIESFDVPATAKN